MKTVYVKAGVAVDESTVLGVEGATGNVTGRHLHIEVHKGEYRYPAEIDPLTFIEEGIAKAEEVSEVQKEIKIRLNGVEKTVTAIEKDGNNYVKLQDLRDSKIVIDYDSAAKMPVVAVNWLSQQ
jgi:murein DD-endopeptidase MepM/ murein hydrolase activator NlpD